MDMDMDTWIRQQVSQSTILTKEREKELLDAWHERQEYWARDELILAHRKLVAGMATHFSSSGATFADLFNEGMIALMSAVNRFDRSKDNRFNTYAAWWIMSQLQDAVHRDIYTVKIGRSRNEKKVLRFLGTARNILGPNLDGEIMDDIAADAKTSREIVEKIDGAMSSRSVSLNAHVGSDSEDGAEVGDMMEDTSEEYLGAEAATLARNQRELLEKLFERLSDPRAPKILRDRWLNEEEKSLRDIGQEHGVSAERIRQIESAAIRELRAYLQEQFPDRSEVLQA